MGKFSIAGGMVVAAAAMFAAAPAQAELVNATNPQTIKAIVE